MPVLRRGALVALVLATVAISRFPSVALSDDPPFAAGPTQDMDAATRYAEDRRDHPDCFEIDPAALSLIRDVFPETPEYGPGPDDGIAYQRVRFLGGDARGPGGYRVVQVGRAIYGMLSPRGLGDVFVLDAADRVVEHLSGWTADLVSVDELGQLRNKVGAVEVTPEGIRGWVRCWDVIPTEAEEKEIASRPQEDRPMDPEADRILSRMDCYRDGAPWGRLLGRVGDLAVVDVGRDILVVTPEGRLVATANESCGQDAHLDAEGRLHVGEGRVAPVGPMGFEVTGAQVFWSGCEDPDPCGRYTPEAR